jgi:RNA polymerase sigma-70 factor (ECF subfamily)
MGVPVDDGVVVRAQRGDEHAFGTIVNESIDRLYAIAILISRDATLAEDAVQDALIRAWRDLPNLRDPARINAWMARLTVNATYDQLRKRRRIRGLSRPDEDIVATADETAATINRTSLKASYDRLPVEQRAVVVMHYYLGLSLDEAAQALAIPPGTVRSRLNAALKTMRREFDLDHGANS